MSFGRFRERLAPHVANGVVSSLLAVLSKNGAQDVFAASAEGSSGTPIALDSVIRISSLTKPIAAATTLALAERRCFSLDDPIGRFVPELAARGVLRSVESELDDVEPARRPVTIRHLLTCTMGFGFPMTKGPHPIVEAAAALNLGLGPPKPRTPHPPDEWLRHFASLPLMAHPGTTWMYDTSFSVLGVVLSRAGRAPLEDVVRESVLDPLGMSDTSFTVPATKLSRLVPCTGAERQAIYDGVDDSQWATPPPFPDAAGGLVSTANDFLRFARMLLDRGIWEGRRILSEASVAAMTSNHIQPSQRGPASAPFLEERGWGLGLSVAIAREGDWSRVGRYGWEGGLGTSWFNDPGTGEIALLIAQSFPPPFQVFEDFWRAATTGR